jgi:hypothetical protein
MELARRLVQSQQSDAKQPVSRELELLRAVVQSGAANLALCNVKGETVASILGAADSTLQVLQSRLAVLDTAATDSSSPPK